MRGYCHNLNGTSLVEWGFAVVSIPSDGGELGASALNSVTQESSSVPETVRRGCMWNNVHKINCIKLVKWERKPKSSPTTVGSPFARYCPWVRVTDCYLSRIVIWCFGLFCCWELLAHHPIFPSTLEGVTAVWEMTQTWSLLSLSKSQCCILIIRSTFSAWETRHWILVSDK